MSHHDNSHLENVHVRQPDGTRYSHIVIWRILYCQRLKKNKKKTKQEKKNLQLQKESQVKR